MATTTFLQILLCGLTLIDAYVNTTINECYAGPDIFGQTCKAATGIMGAAGTTVVYSAAADGDTTLFCEGTGMSYLGTMGSPCEFGFKNIGPTGLPLLWDASAGTPEIHCKGVPLGSTFKWSAGAGSGTISCCGAQVGSGVTYDMSHSTCCRSPAPGVCPSPQAVCCSGGDTCCPHGNVCCTQSDACCASEGLCCGDGCCQSGYNCCPSKKGCCGGDSPVCCPNETCCPANYPVCCSDGCCPSAYPVCEAGGKCGQLGGNHTVPMFLSVAKQNQFQSNQKHQSLLNQSGLN